MFSPRSFGLMLLGPSRVHVRKHYFRGRTRQGMRAHVKEIFLLHRRGSCTNLIVSGSSRGAIRMAVRAAFQRSAAFAGGMFWYSRDLVRYKSLLKSQNNATFLRRVPSFF